MTLKADASTLHIEGNIKTISDFQEIKNSLDSMSQREKSISIKVVDSISMTSSVIGYLVKLIHKDGVRLSVSVGDERLHALLSDLGLVSEFNVKKVG